MSTETKTYTGTGGDMILLGQDPGTIERVELDGIPVPGAVSSVLNGTDNVFCLVRPHTSNDGIWQKGSVVTVTADWTPKEEPKEKPEPKPEPKPEETAPAPAVVVAVVETPPAAAPAVPIEQ